MGHEVPLLPTPFDPGIVCQRCSDSSPKDLNGFFPFDPPSTLEEWEKRKEKLVLRMQVATGLYPMPPKTAVIHGKINRPGFTVEKVYFESVPGFYVTGLLFRPENPKKEKLPAVLNPHGHGGRLQDYGEKGVLNQIVIGAERFRESGRMQNCPLRNPGKDGLRSFSIRHDWIRGQPAAFLSTRSFCQASSGI